MSRFPLFLATVGTFSLAGCATIGEMADPLVSQAWALEGIERPGQEPQYIDPSLGARHTLDFQSDGRLAIQLDCNRGNSDWSRYDEGYAPPGEGSALRIGEIASTRALCPRPSFGEEMAAALPLASGYQIVDGGRTLLLRTRTATYRFTAR
ncbi:META domain-containing protein [Sphingomicrobium sp. XHP0239]|uniref:META domain-containing protein n=1 Tax=Sphingomicrobium maritimum TaxID=3133972 RepID=UPI0031CCC96A